MIYSLAGTCLQLEGNLVTLDVHGVGYGALIPLSDILGERAGEEIKVGQELTLWIHTWVRQDVLKLYGFRSLAKKNLFLELIKIKDVGPQVALAILSTLEIPQLQEAVVRNETRTLEKVPGIGKRKAERIIVELRQKWENLPAIGSQVASAEETPLFGNAQGGSASLKRAGGKALPSKDDHSGDPSAQLLSHMNQALQNLGYSEKSIRQLNHDLTSHYESTWQSWDFSQLMREALKIVT